jgi:hypothetical protein
MHTHVMVGTNEPDKARVFYDPTFAAFGISGQHPPSGAFGVVTPRDESRQPSPMAVRSASRPRTAPPSTPGIGPAWRAAAPTTGRRASNFMICRKD